VINERKGKERKIVEEKDRERQRTVERDVIPLPNSGGVLKSILVVTHYLVSYYIIYDYFCAVCFELGFE
jgi:hypothetical protein